MPRFIKVAAIIYAAYLALALLIVTPALNLLPHWYVEKTWGRQLQSGWILLNPLTLSLELRRLQLSQPNGEPFVALEEASFNLSITSLWQTGWVFDAVHVTGLEAHIVQFRDGVFNFADLTATNPDQAAPEPQDTGLPGVTVTDFLLQSKTINYHDHTREKPYSSNWNDLKLHVLNLSTVIEAGRPYSLDVTGPEGGTLHWEGTVSIPKSSSEGSLSLANLGLFKLWELGEPWLAFEVRHGRMLVEGNYRLDWSDGINYRISDGRMGVSGLDIAPKDPGQLPDTGVTLHALEISDIVVDGPAQNVAVGGISIDALAAAGWREESRISLSELFTGPGEQQSDTAETPQEDSEQSGWSASLGKISVVNSSLHWRSSLTDPRELEVSPIEASVENLNWPLSGDSPFALGLSINEEATIAIDGTLALAEGNGELNYTLEGLPLPWFNPNLPRALKAKFSGGTVHIDGQASLTEFTPTLVELGGAIRQFSAHRTNVDTQLTGWETVRIEGLSVDLEQNSLVLEKLAIDDYKGRIHIAEDGSVNAMNVWQEEVGEQAEEIAEELSRDKPWSFGIRTILVSDSEIDFMDQSLPIPFRVVIGDINGELRGLDSEPGSRSKVEIKGAVDSYAPVALEGELNPLSEPPALDLDLSFEGVDMALLSPYSGTYAGHAIERGLLNLNLNYTLEDNQLRGDNDLRIDRLKLGEKIDSDKAIDAPLELALAIMTDSNGVIAIQVPVSGNVDDPQFDLGSVIGKAFFNIITKAVTAPFTLLAGLVGSEEDLQRVTFSPGYAELNEAGRKKLEQLAQALLQRPGLSLVITGRLNPPADRERLQKLALGDQLLGAGLAREELDSKGPGWEKAIRKRYRALPQQNSGDADPTVREQYLAVARSITINNEELLELAEQRAVAVKAYLVNEAGMEADRAVLEQTGLDDEASRFSGVELDIDT